jgi:sulfoxide reductase heme-binding subunit YedZ
MNVKHTVNRWLLQPAAKPMLWAVYTLPALALLAAALTDRLGANPAEKLIRETGEWALRWLWLTLAISPARELLSMPGLLRHRRALGVTTFIYAVLHLLCYAWLDKGLVIDDIVRDVFKRNFIFVGMAALLLMTPLALTSFNAAIRALGGQKWKLLHKLTYFVAFAALLHFYWMKSAKQNFNEVGVYAAILAVLLGWRAMRAGGPLKWIWAR